MMMGVADEQIHNLADGQVVQIWSTFVSDGQFYLLGCLCKLECKMMLVRLMQLDW